MPSTRSPSADETRPHPDFIWPPRHRLFVVFDTFEDAAGAAQRLRLSGRFTGPDDIWLLEGEEGLRTLDPTGSVHGARGRMVRFVEMTMAPNDLEYLRLLGQEVRHGHVVLAVRVPDGRSADETGRALLADGGHSMGYGAHLDFVPVAS